MLSLTIECFRDAEKCIHVSVYEYDDSAAYRSQTNHPSREPFRRKSSGFSTFSDLPISRSRFSHLSLLLPSPTSPAFLSADGCPRYISSFNHTVIIETTGK